MEQDKHSNENQNVEGDGALVIKPEGVENLSEENGAV